MKKIVLLSLAVFAALSLSAQQPRDWAQYGRYERQNAALAGEPVEVVFMGNSITDNWIGADPDFFARNTGKFFYFSSKARRTHSSVSYPDGCYLVFGKETAGLPEELLVANEEHCVRIPMIPDSRARCLNLSNSVAVGAYEVLRQWGYPEMLCEGELHRLSWK